LSAAALVAVVAGATVRDPLADLDAYPEFQRGLRKYRQHHHPLHRLRGHHPHKMALTHHFAHGGRNWAPEELSAPKMNWSPDDDYSQAKPVDTGRPVGMLPGRHPSVEKALDGMAGELVNLKEKQNTAKETRGQLEGKVSEVVRHMNDAMSIKHAIGQKEAEIRRERSKLAGLEREAKHIEETHASLVSSLHRVLEPKIMFAQHRLEKKELFLQKEAQAVKVWQEKKDQVHAHALEVLEEKKQAHQGVLQAEQDLVAAKAREEAAEHKYNEARQHTSSEIQSYRYAETRVTAEETHFKAAEEAALAAKESVKRLGNVLQVESEKVEESMTVSKNQIRHRMQKIEVAGEKTQREIVALKQQYRDWQENQRLKAAEVVKKAQETSEAAEAYTNRQKEVLDSANSKVAHDAEVKSDWAGESWESGFSNDAGFTDSTPSFSD